MIIKCVYFSFFVPIVFIKLYLSFCFIASFAFVLQRHRAKPIPPLLSASEGSPFGRAPAIAGERGYSHHDLPSPSATPPPLPKGEAFC